MIYKVLNLLKTLWKEGFMNNKKLTGLAMLLPIPATILWVVFGVSVMENIGPDKPSEYIAKLGANAAAAKYIYCIATLLFVTAIGSLGYIKRSMEGGSGHYIAGFAWFLLIIGAAGQLGETAFTIAIAEAAESATTAATAAMAMAAAGADATAAMAAATTSSGVAASMYASAQAIGSLTTGFSMIGFALFGFAICQQKNFHRIIAYLMVISGIFTLILCVVDYESQLIAIGYIGITVSFATLGVSLLRSKE
jgi:hypothetical protein